eukprot:6196583-Pleurochrysis_carterae.AAC.2
MYTRACAGITSLLSPPCMLVCCQQCMRMNAPRICGINILILKHLQATSCKPTKDYANGKSRQFTYSETRADLPTMTPKMALV